MYRKWLAFTAVLSLFTLIAPIHTEAQPPSGRGGGPGGPGGFGGGKGGGPGGPGGFQRGPGGPGGFQGGPQPGQPMVVQIQGQPGGAYQVQQPGGDRPRGFGGPQGYQGGPQGYQGGPQGYQGGPQGYQGGPQGGDRRDRGPGGGGSQDPERIFQMLVQVSGGRDTIRFDSIPPETKAVMRQMSERMGTPPLPESGEWTKSQFMDFYQRSQAMRQQGGPQGPGGSSGDDRGLQRLREQDRDGDGRVSRAEADRMLQPNFDRIDADRDGYVTLEEYRGYYASQGGGGNNRDPRDNRDNRDQGRPGDPYSGNFYDTGSGRTDGRDQKKEPDVAIRYGKLPKDAPGYFNEYDMNKDGQLELSEWRLNGGDIRDFIKYDLDADGILTYGEYNRYKEQQAALAKTTTKSIDPDTGEEIEVDAGPSPSPRFNPGAGGGNGNMPRGPVVQQPNQKSGNNNTRPDQKSGPGGSGGNPFRNGGKK